MMMPDWDHMAWQQAHDERKASKQAKNKIPKKPPPPAPEDERKGGGDEPRPFDPVLGF